MDIKVGEYIRTKSGKIDIFKEKDENYMFARCQKNTYWIFDITKYSKNLIDLIEVGDIVEIILNEITGKTTKVYIANKEQIEAISTMNVKMLATILTHEQYNANCFKVKGE